jgi:hypothetical protein
MFIAVLSFVIGAFALGGSPAQVIHLPHRGTWL